MNPHQTTHATSASCMEAAHEALLDLMKALMALDTFGDYHGLVREAIIVREKLGAQAIRSREAANEIFKERVAIRRTIGAMSLATVDALKEAS
jgi:hypothetical protein